MRLCVFSNSHAAALKWALTEGGSVAGLEARIFAAPATGLNQMIFDTARRRFVTRNPKIAQVLRTTSDGLDEIDIDDYDAYLIHGLYFTVPRLDRRHSTAVRIATADSLVGRFAGLSLARTLRAATDAPIALSPDPLYADQGATAGRYPVDVPSKPMDYADACALMVERIGDPGVLYLWQDRRTIGPNLSTLDDYATGSRRILSDEERHASDVRHMNGDYGRLVLEGAEALFRNALSLRPRTGAKL